MKTVSSNHAKSVAQMLDTGMFTSKQLCDALGLSQPSMSRVLKSMGSEVIKTSIHGSIQYLLKDHARSHLVSHISRVTVDGQLQRLGVLEPVRPEGFLLVAVDGRDSYSEGLPWWLFDMRPQGYLGRAYARKNAERLALPERLGDWSDAHVLQALKLNGSDLCGHLLVGEGAEQMFINMPTPTPVPLDGRAQAYAKLSALADAGEVAGSSAGGEQPKFTSYVETDTGAAHVIVKFSALDSNPVSERWRDLLLAEHHALEVLQQAGIPAAQTRIVDSESQRFLEVARFDRIGALGRSALVSLAALDAEFLGLGTTWYEITQALVQEGCVVPEAMPSVQLLWAYGTLIGNTDMHAGNLSFTSDSGRPYRLAPAYDMTPMAFAPRAGGSMANDLRAANIVAAIRGDVWRQAYGLAQLYAERLRRDERFRARFFPCMDALTLHLDGAKGRIGRIA